jgi:hypothetical protein
MNSCIFSSECRIANNSATLTCWLHHALQADINDNISREDAAAKEHEFFKRDAFFGSTAVALVRERFGVDALRVQLSKQLVSLTQRELPKMKEALDELLAQVSKTNLSFASVQ